MVEPKGSCVQPSWMLPVGSVGVSLEQGEEQPQQDRDLSEDLPNFCPSEETS